MHLDENVSIHLRMRELIKNQSKLLFFAGPPMVLGSRKKESALWAYFSSKNRSDRKIKLCWKCWRPGKYHCCLTYKTIQAFKTWRSVCGYSEKKLQMFPFVICNLSLSKIWLEFRNGLVAFKLRLLLESVVWLSGLLFLTIKIAQKCSAESLIAVAFEGTS